MAKLSRDLTVGTLHPRELLFGSGNLGSLNAEVVVAADGCASLSLDLRGVFSGTFEVAGTVDGVNWTMIPVRPVNIAAVRYVAAVTGAVAGTWVGACLAFKLIRVRCTAYTSGAAVATLAGSPAPIDQSLQGMVTTDALSIVGASGALTTLSLPAPGVGLRHYLTYLSINRIAAAVLTASVTPVTVTTTNTPGTLPFSFPSDAAALGTIDRWREDFAYPLAAVAQNTATTIVGPVTAGVIWRITAGWYVAP